MVFPNADSSSHEFGQVWLGCVKWPREEIPICAFLREFTYFLREFAYFLRVGVGPFGKDLQHFAIILHILIDQHLTFWDSLH